MGSSASCWGAAVGVVGAMVSCGCFVEPDSNPAPAGTSAATDAGSGSVDQDGSEGSSTGLVSGPSSGGETGSSGDASSSGGCAGPGCACDEADPCPESLACVEGLCVAAICGNGVPEPGEACDDGNATDFDGCDADCSRTAVAFDLSFQKTCAVIGGGARVRCWGKNSSGQLGYGFTGDLGDEPGEEPSALDDVPLPDGRRVLQLRSGDDHTCALLEAVAPGAAPGVVCWGVGSGGRLGYGNRAALADRDIGDDEFPAGLPCVDVGFGDAGVATLGTGGTHTCVLTDAGQIWCWGRGEGGQLGYGDELDIGTALTPAAPSAVSVGAAIRELATGVFQSCAILANDRIRCWGTNGWGQLGYGTSDAVGDDELPSTASALVFRDRGGAPEVPVDVVAGWTFSCALFESGAVRCWGLGSSGELGWGFQDELDPAFGDDPDEDVAALDPIALLPPGSDQRVVAIAAGDAHACALTDDGELRCWGQGFSGQLGQGNRQHIGDDEVPADVPPVDFGGAAVVQFDAGGSHTCAALDDGRAFCFGSNSRGQLGRGDLESVGDDEPVLDAGELPLF